MKNKDRVLVAFLISASVFAATQAKSATPFQEQLGKSVQVSTSQYLLSADCEGNGKPPTAKNG